MILPAEVPVSLYIDIWKWTTCLWIQVVCRPNQVGFNKQTTFNSLAPGRFEPNFGEVISMLISVTDGWGISCKIALRWMPLDLTDDKSTLVQVMVWCRQATSHYLCQCWPRYMSTYGVTRPQWVNVWLHITTTNFLIYQCFEWMLWTLFQYKDHLSRYMYGDSHHKHEGYETVLSL